MAGSHMVGTGDFLFALGPEDGPQFTYADDTFIVDGTPYDDLMGWRLGDYHEVSQDVDVTALDYIYLQGKGQNIDGTPTGTAWEFSIWVGGGKLAKRVLSEREISLNDVKAPVSHLVGVQTIKFRLELVVA